MLLWRGAPSLSLPTGSRPFGTPQIGFLREPPSPANEERYSTRALIRDIPNLLRSNTPFRLLVLLQALFGFAQLGAPLYILAASGALQAVVSGVGGQRVLGVGYFLAVLTGRDTRA